MSESKIIKEQSSTGKKSQLITAIKQLNDKITTDISGQYGQFVSISSGGVVLQKSQFDIEFVVSFDDDTEADVAEVTIYNLTNSTANKFKSKAQITISAGYTNNKGVIFTGYITSKKTYWDGLDKITEIRAVDSLSRVNKEVESISYKANTKASYILKDLCGRAGASIAVFKTLKDYTYTDEVTVDGDLSEAIVQYAKVCGVSAYMSKGKINVRPLSDGDNTKFKLSANTGLLSVSEFEEEETINDKTVVTKGFDIECLLQCKLQTASIIELNSTGYSGTFRVREGSHECSDGDFVTKAKIVKV